MNPETMSVTIKRFDDLTNRELYDMYRLRTEVFVVEQNCPYQEVDYKDLHSYHLAVHNGDELAACLRIIDKGISYDSASIGRVCVSEKYRGLGLGRLIMTSAVNYMRDELNESEINISAQARLKKFYESVGFHQVSDVYLEDDIPHIQMTWTLQ